MPLEIYFHESYFFNSVFLKNKVYLMIILAKHEFFSAFRFYLTWKRLNLYSKIIYFKLVSYITKKFFFIFLYKYASNYVLTHKC